MRNLKKLLPTVRRAPKTIAIFSNCQRDCDRLIHHVLHLTANSPAAAYPIHVYSLEVPLEADRCARVVVERNSRRLFRRAQQELAGMWVALSATSWNNDPRGKLIKVIWMTIPPFRGIAGNENGDYFHLKMGPIARHLSYRFRQRIADLGYRIAGIVRNVAALTHGAVRQCHLQLARLLGHLRAKWLDTRQKNANWCMAVALKHLARIAGNVQPFTYAAFKNLSLRSECQGTTMPMDLGPSVPMNGGVTRIEYSDNRWEWRRVAELAGKSRARFLLFCHSGDEENLDDFLPLYKDPRTFAVTRQTGYREWRSILQALSPFGLLGPKETTRVAAPFTGPLLVERAKFLKLPLPRTPVFGAAWLELFWRAGAVGWRSYSVGGSKPLIEQSDYFLEELLFVRKLYRDRALQQISPLAAQLCRGNIAFRPDLSTAYRGLPRVLVVSPYLPFPPSHGGAVRLYNMCKALAEQLDLILISFRDGESAVDYEELHKIFRRVYVVDRDEIYSNPHLPGPVNQFESSSMRALIGSVAEEEAINLLQIEWTDMARYRNASPRTPAILVEHDVTCTLYRQYAEQEIWPDARQEYERWLSFERERLPDFDGVFVMSRQDKEDAIRCGSRADRTFVVPNGVDVDRFRALAPPQGTREILFVGSFMHSPNLIGFDELRLRIMPQVWERAPDAILRVVAGRDHERYWQTADVDSRVILHDFVQDIAPYYDRAHLVVVPLVVGAGTCIKLIEALACQRAVVTTPVGARGLDLVNERDAIICEVGGKFADAIVMLLENPALRDEIARGGRLTAEKRFDWKASADRAMEAYAALMGESVGLLRGPAILK